jgi:hypothetical protein
MDWLEEFWADMLSEEPIRIVAAWVTLDEEAKAAIWLHLERMTTEEGWAEAQRAAAQAALDTIEQEGGPRTGHLPAG